MLYGFHRREVMVSSLFVMIRTLCNVIFVIALCSHACVICIFCCLFVICSNLPQSALSFETCVIIPFVYMIYILKKTYIVLSFNCRLCNAKISALVIGNEKHRYRPKKVLSVELCRCYSK